MWRTEPGLSDLRFLTGEGSPGWQVLSKHGEIPSRHSLLVIEEKVMIIPEPLAHQCIVALCSVAIP